MKLTYLKNNYISAIILTSDSLLSDFQSNLQGNNIPKTSLNICIIISSDTTINKYNKFTNE